MSGFQRNDVLTKIGEVDYVLRLTLGALAEIDQRLGVRGPLELAEKLKSFSADKSSARSAAVLLECLLRPALLSYRGGAASIPAIAKQARPENFMPLLAKLFEESFS